MPEQSRTLASTTGDDGVPACARLPAGPMFTPPPGVVMATGASGSTSATAFAACSCAACKHDNSKPYDQVTGPVNCDDLAPRLQ